MQKMKKLLGIVVLSLFFCTNIFAKPVLLECISDDPIFEDEEVKDYLSLDLDKKNFIVLGTKTKLKGDCALGNCEKLTKINRKLPFISEDHEYLTIGEKDFNSITINKQTLKFVWYSYYMNELSNGTYEKVDDYSSYSCKKTNNHPFQ
mgnify:CR=1 FL=1